MRITSKRGIAPVSDPAGLKAFWASLQELKLKLEYLEKLPQLETILLDSWDNTGLSIGWPDRVEELFVSRDGKYIWTRREEEIMVYSVPDPEELLALLERWSANTVEGATDRGPFATADEPWKWSAGIYPHAVEEALAHVTRISRISGTTTFADTSTGHFTQDRFRELTVILNGIPEGSYFQSSYGNMSLNRFCYPKAESVSVSMVDGVNGLAVALRYCHGEIEMALFSDLDKVRNGEYVLTRVWRIEDEDLTAFMEELYDDPPASLLYVGDGTQWDHEVIFDHDGGEASLRIIQGWQYEFVNGPEHYGIRCRPLEVDEGWIYYSFWPDGYSPEETDDRFYTEGDFCGHPITKSYPASVSTDGISYDTENAVWSYFRIRFDEIDFAMINQGADDWFLEYKDQIFDICFTMEFSFEIPSA